MRVRTGQKPCYRLLRRGDLGVSFSVGVGPLIKHAFSRPSYGMVAAIRLPARGTPADNTAASCKIRAGPKIITRRAHQGPPPQRVARHRDLSDRRRARRRRPQRRRRALPTRRMAAAVTRFRDAPSGRMRRVAHRRAAIRAIDVL